MRNGWFGNRAVTMRDDGVVPPGIVIFLLLQKNEPCCVLAAPLTESQAVHLARLLKALADPVRVRLLSLVATASSGEVCACDFPSVLGKSQSTISHHLSQMVAAGILSREQRGKWAWLKPGAGLCEVRAALSEPADA